MEHQLRSGLDELGLHLSDAQVAQLLSYAGLLQKWGRVYNLTALRSDEDIVRQHLLDSLAVIPPMRRELGEMPCRLLDVGSGAGLPGAVIAIVSPGTRVDCLDAVAKKAAFVQQAASTLGLANLRGVHSRIEAWSGTYPLVTSRAFASLADFVRWSQASLEPTGAWMAMKGRYPADELAELPADVEMFHVEHLTVPGLAAERCLVWLRRRVA